MIASKGGAKSNPQKLKKNPKTRGTTMEAQIGTFAVHFISTGCSTKPSITTIAA